MDPPTPKQWTGTGEMKRPQSHSGRQHAFPRADAGALQKVMPVTAGHMRCAAPSCLVIH